MHFRYALYFSALLQVIKIEFPKATVQTGCLKKLGDFSWKSKWNKTKNET